MVNRRRITAALVGLLVLVLGGWLVKDAVDKSSSSAPAPASPSSVSGGASGAKLPGAGSGLRVEALSALPPQARDTWKLIQSGGPYPYPRNDNVVFENREKVLPRDRKSVV